MSPADAVLGWVDDTTGIGMVDTFSITSEWGDVFLRPLSSCYNIYCLVYRTTGPPRGTDRTGCMLLVPVL